ncbi:MAG TPA: helix-turn-helix transcriptional regulator [Pseudonocardiaceae bacterium]|nr:helix-turn-helix transcriptional regulator [Pseudonocardiaceae bacterium]
MAERGDPSALRWLIGVELANYRKRSGLTMAEAAKAIGCSPAKVGHLESGRNQQQPSDVTELMRGYRADRSDIDRLASLAASADQQTWWAPWTEVVPDWLRTFVGLEGLASHVHDYSTAVFPALLQTEAYSLGVTVGNIRVRPDHNDRMVGLRMNRQQRVFSEVEPLCLTALIEEAVLDRPIGGAEVMRRQLEYLITMSSRDNVEIRVVPTSVGRHDALIGPFNVLDFPQAQSIGYVEVLNGALYVQDQDQVDGYTRALRGLLEIALSPADSVAAFRSRIA